MKRTMFKRAAIFGCGAPARLNHSIASALLIVLTLGTLLTLTRTEIFGQSGGGDANRRINVKIGRSGEISIKANRAATEEAARELSRRLKIPVILSPLMRGKTITLDFENLPLEQAVRMFSPHTRIDYVQSQAENGTPQPVAVYLNGYNEPEPSTARSVENRQTAIVIEGDTEAANDAQDRRLKISIAGERLTLFARRQSLSFVLSEIASRAGIEFDFRYDGEQAIDAEIRDEPLNETLVRLSPHVRVYTRKDFTTGQTTTFKISLSKYDEKVVSEIK